MIGSADAKLIAIAGCKFSSPMFRIIQPRIPAPKILANDASGLLASQNNKWFITKLYSKNPSDRLPLRLLGPLY